MQLQQSLTGTQGSWLHSQHASSAPHVKPGGRHAHRRPLQGTFLACMGKKKEQEVSLVQLRPSNRASEELQTAFGKCSDCTTCHPGKELTCGSCR